MADVAGVEEVHVVTVTGDAQGDTVAAQLRIAGADRRATEIERILVTVMAFRRYRPALFIEHQVYVELAAPRAEGTHVAGGAE